MQHNQVRFIKFVLKIQGIKVYLQLTDLRYQTLDIRDKTTFIFIYFYKYLRVSGKIFIFVYQSLKNVISQLLIFYFSYTQVKFFRLGLSSKYSLLFAGKSPGNNLPSVSYYIIYSVYYLMILNNKYCVLIIIIFCLFVYKLKQ